MTGDRLTLRHTGERQVSLRACDVLAISYDYNAFRGMHANTLRLVYVLHNDRAFIEFYEEQHTRVPLLAWLRQHFHSTVASRYEQLWGSPGGDSPSVQLWAERSEG